jgi:hypothetical protein
MVSNVRELFRRGARDETFGPEMGVISMLVKLEGVLKGPDLSVMAGLRPGHPRLTYLAVALSGCCKDVDARHKAGHGDASRKETLRAISRQFGQSGLFAGGEHLNPERGPLGRVSKGAAALWFETREGALLTMRN